MNENANSFHILFASEKHMYSKLGIMLISTVFTRKMEHYSLEIPSISRAFETIQKLNIIQLLFCYYYTNFMHALSEYRKITVLYRIDLVRYDT